MYNLDWAREVCGDLQHYRKEVTVKESVHELVKLMVLYVAFMAVTGGSVITLNYFLSKYEINKKIQIDEVCDSSDTINVQQIHNNVNVKQR